MEVNQNRMDRWVDVDRNFHFRRGLVGDKKNCLAEETKERLDKVTHMKFEGSGMEVQI